MAAGLNLYAMEGEGRPSWPACHRVSTRRFYSYFAINLMRAGALYESHCKVSVCLYSALCVTPRWRQIGGGKQHTGQARTRRTLRYSLNAH